MDQAGNDIRGLAEFIIAKHRNGQVGSVKMRFASQFVRFENWNDSRTSVQEITAQSRMNRSDGGDSGFGAPAASSFAGGFGPAPDAPMPDIMPGPSDSVVPF